VEGSSPEEKVMTPNRNIVQAEFFLVNVRADSLDDMLADCAERKADDVPIKCVVRFYDNGTVTRFAKLLAWMKKKKDEHVKLGWCYSKPPRTLFDYLIWAWVDIAGDWLNERKVSVVARQLKRATRARQTIAVESEGHRFREAHRDELHELTEAARAASDVWLFVFKPNHLLADKNEFVVHAM
jgi:hypothetical protein